MGDGVMRSRGEPIEQGDTEELFPILNQLVDMWCERRALPELRWILRGYPMENTLTDDWHHLQTALENLRAFCRDSMTGVERERVDYALRLVGFILAQPR